MTFAELKDKLKDLTESFFTEFSQTAVKWSREVGPSPEGPLVLLIMGDIIRPGPMRRTINGSLVDKYYCQTTLKVDLHTNERTAADHLAAFFNYLNSPQIDEWCYVNGVDIRTGNIQDLADKRAMTELGISFVQIAHMDRGHFTEVDLTQESNKNKPG